MLQENTNFYKLSQRLTLLESCHHCQVLTTKLLNINLLHINRLIISFEYLPNSKVNVILIVNIIGILIC